MNDDDDDPPSRATPSSSHSASTPPPGNAGLEWPDDETYAGTAPPESPGKKRPTMSARLLLEEPALDLNLSLAAGGTGVERAICHSRIQKSGLALAGHFHGIVPTRIQILGQTEQSFVAGLEPVARQRALMGFFGLGLSCVVLTGDLVPSAREVIACADVTGTPLLHATERSSVTITSLHALLDERLAPRKRLHGVLIDVFGVGLLLIGPSEVGKSECALDLVMRGHRLVADDVVDCSVARYTTSHGPARRVIVGQPAALLEHHIEIRGLGVLNVKDLFGVTSVTDRIAIDLVVHLSDNIEGAGGLDFDRLGVDERHHEILGVKISEVTIPVRPGRDIAAILQIAARNELLKRAGHHGAKAFRERLEQALLGGVTGEGKGGGR